MGRLGARLGVDGSVTADLHVLTPLLKAPEPPKVNPEVLEVAQQIVREIEAGQIVAFSAALVRPGHQINHYAAIVEGTIVDLMVSMDNMVWRFRNRIFGGIV